MPNNQYKPPQVRVADPPQSDRGPLPGSIKVALFLIVLFVLVECYHQIERMGMVSSGEISGLSFLAGWVRVGIIAAVGIFLARGSSWTRWVLLAMMLYELYQLWDALRFLSFGVPEDFSLFANPVALLKLSLPALLSLGAVILVFGPGRAWFRPQ